MRNALNCHECQWKKKKTKRDTYTFFSTKHVTRNFHIAVVQNNPKVMYKKVSCTCKVVCLLIRPIDLFAVHDAIAV